MIFMPFLSHGGRVGLAGGGSPDDMPLPDLPTPDNPEGLNLPSGVDTSWMSKPYGGHSTNYGPPKESADSAGLAPPPAPSRDITVHKAPPSPQGLAPDVPTSDAQPVQMEAPTVPPGDFGVVPEGMRRPTTNTTVQPMAQTPGAADAARVGRGFLGGNQDWLVPLLHGLGTMASSNSRYLGSAVLQGLGGAADSYENVQNEMMNRGLTGAQHSSRAWLIPERNSGGHWTYAKPRLVRSRLRRRVISFRMNILAKPSRMATCSLMAAAIQSSECPDGQNIYWGDWAARASRRPYIKSIRPPAILRLSGGVNRASGRSAPGSGSG